MWFSCWGYWCPSSRNPLRTPAELQEHTTISYHRWLITICCIMLWILFILCGESHSAAWFGSLSWLLSEYVFETGLNFLNLIFQNGWHLVGYSRIVLHDLFGLVADLDRRLVEFDQFGIFLKLLLKLVGIIFLLLYEILDEHWQLCGHGWLYKSRNTCANIFFLIAR